jgi:hypothetical protein
MEIACNAAEACACSRALRMTGVDDATAFGAVGETVQLGNVGGAARHRSSGGITRMGLDWDETRAGRKQLNLTPGSRAPRAGI